MKTAEETKELFKPFVYPYSGSSYMTDTIDEDAIEINAQECLKIAESYAEQFKSKPNWIIVSDEFPNEGCYFALNEGEKCLMNVVRGVIKLRFHNGGTITDPKGIRLDNISFLK